MRINYRPTRLISSVLLVLVVILLGIIYEAFNLENQQALILGEQPAWEFKADGQILSCLPENESQVFVYTSNAIYLLDSDTGELRWKTNLGEDTSVYRKYTIEAGIRSNGKVVILQRDDGTVVSLSIQDGKILWKSVSTTKAPVYDIGIDSNLVYVTRRSASVAAYDADSGERAWSETVPDRTSLYIFPGNDKVYLGTSYVLYAYDIRTGDMLLEHQLDGFMGKMVIDANSIYITYLNGEYIFTSLDKESLEDQWSIPRGLQSVSEVNAMLVDDSTIYVSGNKLLALSAATGETLWVSDIKDIFGKPVIHHDFLIVQGRTQVYVLNKSDGMLIDKQKIPGFLPLISWMSYSQANPCANQTMLWLANNSNLYAYDLSR